MPDKFEYVRSTTAESEAEVKGLPKPTVFAGIMVRRLRIQNLLSQTELAEKVQVSGSFMSMIETGSLVPTRPLLFRIATVLGVSYELLAVEPPYLVQLREHLQDVSDQDVFDAFDVISKERHRTT